MRPEDSEEISLCLLVLGLSHTRRHDNASCDAVIDSELSFSNVSPAFLVYTRVRHVVDFSKCVLGSHPHAEDTLRKRDRR